MNYLNNSEYSLRNRSNNNNKILPKSGNRPIYNNITSYKVNQRIIRNFTPRQQKLITHYPNSNRNNSPYNNNKVNSFTDSRIVLYQKQQPFLQTEPVYYNDDKIEQIFQRDLTYENNATNKIDVEQLKANFGLLTEKIDKLKSSVSEHKPYLHKNKYETLKRQKISTSNTSKPVRREITLNNTASQFKQVQLKSPDALRYRTLNKGNSNINKEHNVLNRNNITLDNFAYSGGFKQYKKLLPKNVVHNSHKDKFDSSSDIKSFQNTTDKLFNQSYKREYFERKGKVSSFQIKSSLLNDKEKKHSHDKDLNTSINLSDIADDLVHTFEIESNNIDDMNVNIESNKDKDNNQNIDFSI